MGWRMSCDIGKATEGLENELWPRWSDGNVGEWFTIWSNRHRFIGQSLRKQGIKFTQKIIPPKTTKYCQPLDIYFFRQYKLFARRIEENIRHDKGNAVKLHERIFIFNFDSLIYNQFSAPLYQTMLRYAWKASLCVSQDMPLAFRNMLDIISVGLEICNITDCDCSSAIICSWCGIQLCLQHCLLTPDYHEVEWGTYMILYKSICCT